MTGSGKAKQPVNILFSGLFGGIENFLQ
jgi:hypothetical protein